MDNTREKLIELLQSSPTDIMGNHGVGALADHLIANGVTFATDNKWIPVTERLPEKSGLVIGYDIVWGVGCFYYHTDMQTSTWQQITHWMPLPEPPHEE